MLAISVAKAGLARCPKDSRSPSTSARTTSDPAVKSKTGGLSGYGRGSGSATRSASRACEFENLVPRKLRGTGFPVFPPVDRRKRYTKCLCQGSLGETQAGPEAL